MSADIFIFPTVRDLRGDETKGSLTAREALTEIALELFPIGPRIAEGLADEMMSKLRERGFIVAPASDKVT